MSTARIYRFGSFSLDAGERTLFRDGHSIPIPPKDLEVLLVLVENSGRLVQKSFLMSRVWPGTFVEEGNLARHVSAIRSLLTGGMDGTGYIETIPKRGYRFVAKVERLNADSPDSIPAQFIAKPRTDRRASIAVLPFVNHSGNPEQEYFSDGMTDALTTALSRLPSLRVISRTSSMLYKTYTKSLPEIAGVLGVEFILEGSVVRAGSSVRITAQLIDAKDDSHIWADKYDGEIGDVLCLQDRVAAAVAKSICTKESLGELRRPKASLRVIPAAYDAYLEGRHAWHQAVEGSLLKAVHCFETAISIDPEFAHPYAALAHSYATMVVPLAVMPPSENMGHAEIMARKAIALDDGLSEAHTVLGLVQMMFHWDWPAAHRSIQKAIVIDPSNASARLVHSMYLMARNDTERAKAELKEVTALDPLSPFMQSSVACGHYIAQDYAGSVERNERGLQMFPGFYKFYFNQGLVAIQQKRWDDAVEALEKSDQAAGEASFMKALKAYALAQSGRTREAHEVLRSLLDVSVRHYVPATDFAVLYAGLDDRDQAFGWLEAACVEHSPYLIFLGCDPIFHSLRTDSRFPSLLRRIGLPGQ